ncbi:hypothetical protein PTKIN_Ptkin08bG0073300 [Pterospermum kingtungense]
MSLFQIFPAPSSLASISIDEWRGGLPTVFINNLNRRVSKSALWEAFNQYGVVMDVFISFRSKKPFTFAFVRYKSESECRRAVAAGNQRIIDNRIISVRRAQYRWSNRKNMSRVSRVASPHTESAQAISNLRTKDILSYKEVLMENFNNKAPVENLDVVKQVGESSGKNDLVKEVSFCYELKKEHVKWLNFVIIGRLKENVD